jgi:hypothetical protein
MFQLIVLKKQSRYFAFMMKFLNTYSVVGKISLVFSATVLNVTFFSIFHMPLIRVKESY